MEVGIDSCFGCRRQRARVFCSIVNLCFSILKFETLALTSCLPPGSGSKWGAYPIEVMRDSPRCHLGRPQVNGSPNAIIMTLWKALDYQDSLTSQSDTVSRLLANQLQMLQVGLKFSD